MRLKNWNWKWKILEAVLHPTKLIDNLLYTEGLLMTALSCELPVITASKSMTAIGKRMRQLSDGNVLAYKQFMALAG